MNARIDALAVADSRWPPCARAGATNAGGGFAVRIARWNGATWSSMGGIDGPVYALAVYDDGGGPGLYAGGSFTGAGGVSTLRVAKWNGASWSALGSGTNSSVDALQVYDDGGGPAPPWRPFSARGRAASFVAAGTASWSRWATELPARYHGLCGL
jgi:hypothetical protein